MIFPNPVGNEVNFRRVNDEMAGVLEIKVRDVTGKMVSGMSMQKDEVESKMDVRGLAAGIYFVQVRTETGRFYVGKFCKIK